MGMIDVNKDNSIPTPTLRETHTSVQSTGEMNVATDQDIPVTETEMPLEKQ